MDDPSNSFTAAMDIYSLGTILLEIGEWRSLKTLVERFIDFRKLASTIELSKVRTFFLDENPSGGLSMLEYRMVNVCAAVTKTMLSGDAPESFASDKDEYLAFRLT